MINFLYRWLPIVFGCHCKAERSFFINGRQFPICARCTGELAGILISAMTYGVYHPPVLYAAIFMLPMIFDGVIQLLTPYESTNVRRFFTGLFFGYGFFYLILASYAASYRFGYHLIKMK